MIAADSRVRLMELIDAQGVSLSGLSALLGRNPSYLQQFVRKGSPRKLEEGDRRTLARFFGIDEAELGGANEFAGEGGAVASYAGQRKPQSEWSDVPRPTSTSRTRCPIRGHRRTEPRRWLTAPS